MGTVVLRSWFRVIIDPNLLPTKHIQTHFTKTISPKLTQNA